MQRKENMPEWVYWSLWGISTRSVAIGFFIAMLVLTTLFMLGGFIFKGYVLFLSILVPLWFRLAIRWVDKYAAWCV